MDKLEFKKLLFKVSFCTMACDGHIDDREIEEMNKIDKSASFFESIDLSKELTQLIDNFKNKGIKVISELFETIKNSDLNAIQELLILEVALRIIYADEKVDDNEKRFIHLLRAKLKVHDETIHDRFGKIDILRTNDYSNNIQNHKSPVTSEVDLKLPDFSALKLGEFKLQNKK